MGGFLVVHAQQGRRHLQPADLQRRAVERRRRGLHSELPEVGAVVEEPRWAVERIFRSLLCAWRHSNFDSCCTFVLYRSHIGEQMLYTLLVYSGLPPNFRRQSVTADPWPAGGVGRLGDSLLKSPRRLYSSMDAGRP